MKRSVKIISLITIVFAFLFFIVAITKKDTDVLMGVVWIVGTGIIASVLVEIKIKRPVKIVSLITSLLAFLFIMVFVIRKDMDILAGSIWILGLGIGILSTLVERKVKLLFYMSVIIIIIGTGIIGAYQGYINPTQLDQWQMVTDLEPFYAIFIGYLFHNTFVAFESLLGGPIIIIPYLNLYANITHLFNFIASLISLYGFKGVILILGWLNVYPELTGLILAILAGIRIALESFKAVVHIRNHGVFNSLRKIRDAMVFEIINTMPKVMALLLIAAVLETLWTHFWVNYWFQHIL